MTRAISFPKNITNLFDPCCGCGLALRSLAEGNNCYAFGVELDEGRAEEAQTRLHRVGIGSFFYSQISNEAFHAMLLNPPYIAQMRELLEHLKDKEPDYYYAEILKPMGKTLNDFMKE